jgi:hypothetical protein
VNLAPCDLEGWDGPRFYWIACVCKIGDISATAILFPTLKIGRKVLCPGFLEIKKPRHAVQ